MRIILVDDDSDDLYLLQDGLRSHGVTAILTPLADTREALVTVRKLAAERRPPDLVLSDAQMPRMSGLDLMRALRGDPGTASIPLAMLSSSPRTEDEDAAKALGVPVFEKPFRDADYGVLLTGLGRLVPGLVPGKTTGV
jgi:two-component system, chemotaxis family, sensor kinase CheA